MVCLDTDILISLLRGDKAAESAVEEIEGEERPSRTTVITAYELLKGASISSKPEQNTLRVKQLLSNMQVYSLNDNACEEASKIYKELQLSGEKIGEFDILIAGIVIYNDDTLMSRDEHFQLVKNLNLKSW